MNNWKKHIWNLFILGLMIFCFGTAIAYNSKFQSENEIYMFYQTDQKISGSEAKAMQETEKEKENPIAFTLWGTQSEAELLNEDFNRTAQAEVIMMCGDTELVIPSSGYLDADDASGCLISEDLLYQLFGDKESTGQRIVYNGKEYIVRGLIKEAENTFVIQADEESEAFMDVMALSVPGGEYLSSVKNRFSASHLMGNSRVNLHTFAGLGSFMIYLLPICMAVRLFVPYIKGLVRNRRKPFLLITCGIGTLALLILFFRVSGISIQFPVNLIPNQWSDFDFWSAAIDDIRNDLWTLMLAEKKIPESIVMSNFLQTFKYGLFTILLYLFFVRKWVFESLNKLYVYSFFTVVFAFVTTWFYRADIPVLGQSKSLWYLTLVYFAGLFLYEYRYVVKNFAEPVR